MKKIIIIFASLLIISCGGSVKNDSVSEREKDIQDSISRAQRQKAYAEEKINEYNDFKALLEQYIKEMDSRDFSDKSTKNDIENHVIYLEKVGDDVLKGESHDSLEIKNLAKKLRKILISVQIREFPKLRKEYGVVSDRICWEDDIDVSVYGTTITYTGGYFASNRNISDWHNSLSSMLKMLRFKRANYKWFEYDSRYTYYSMESPKDNEIVNSSTF